MELAMGFEPATPCLQGRCSTVELRQLRGTDLKILPLSVNRETPLFEINLIQNGTNPLILAQDMVSVSIISIFEQI